MRRLQHVLSEARPPQHTINALHALRGLVSPGGMAYLTLIPLP